jgi:hypothetical protein
MDFIILARKTFTAEEKKQFLAGCEAFRKEIPNFETPHDASEQVFASLHFQADAPDTPFQMGFIQEAYDTGCSEVNPQEQIRRNIRNGKGE